MKNVKVMTMLLAVAVVLCSVPAMGLAADQKIYRQNLTSNVEDNTLRSSAINQSYGSDNNIWVTVEGSTHVYRDVIRFADIHDDGIDEVTGATLQLYLTANHLTGTDTLTIDVYRLHEDNAGWAEGATGDRVAGASCWRSQKYTDPEWAGGQNGAGVSGTDYYAISIGSLAFSATTATNNWYETSITASTVQTWADDNSKNAGFLLMASGTVNGRVEFRAKDYGDYGTLSPTLVVDYIPEPATMTLLLLGLPLALRRRK